MSGKSHFAMERTIPSAQRACTGPCAVFHCLSPGPCRCLFSTHVLVVLLMLHLLVISARAKGSELKLKDPLLLKDFISHKSIIKCLC